jgi:hypothetical protein
VKIYRTVPVIIKPRNNQVNLFPSIWEEASEVSEPKAIGLGRGKLEDRSKHSIIVKLFKVGEAVKLQYCQQCGISESEFW